MAKSQQRISKGFYQYLQVENFVEVENYIFVGEDNKKGLLIRFLNDLDVSVDSMEYKVIQLDAEGNVIEKTDVKHTNMKFLPKSMFVTETALIVDERCCDFKVVFNCVRSGDYVYRIREGRVIVDLVLPPAPLLKKKKRLFAKEAHRFSVRRRAVIHPHIAALSPIIVLILTLICLVMYMSFDYAKAYNKIGEEKQNKAKAEGYTACYNLDYEA